MTHVSACLRGPMFGSQYDECCVRGPVRKCASFWMLVVALNDEILEHFSNIYPFRKTFKKQAFLNFQCEMLNSYPVALLQPIQPMCNGDVAPSVKFWKLFASDELSVYWRNIKRQHTCVLMSAERQNKDCGQRIVLLGSGSLFWTPYMAPCDD